MLASRAGSDKDWWLFSGFTSVGGRMTYRKKSERVREKKSRRVNTVLVAELTRPGSDKDWWLFPGFTSVGGRTIYHKKVNITIPRPKKTTIHNHTNSRTRIGGCSLGSLKWGVGRITTKKNKKIKRSFSDDL